MLIFPHKASTITGFSPIDNSKNEGYGFSGQGAAPPCGGGKLDNACGLKSQALVSQSHKRL
jgi:hypothetical protein